MLCMACGEKADKDFTTDVVKRLEDIVERAKKLMQENSIIDYNKVA
ncbi:MAG: hypothetical protein ACK5JH_16435 [Anaerocolumna sp.]